MRNENSTGGYNGYSKSNRAVAAEEAGLLTASRFGELIGCSAAAVNATFAADEWHHSSKAFNRVNYFEPTRYLGDDRNDEADGLIAKAKRFDADAKTGEDLGECEVTYLQWSGTIGSRSRTNRPTATEVTVTATVTKKGQFYAIRPTDGTAEFRKKTTTRGLLVASLAKVAERNARKAAEVAAQAARDRKANIVTAACAGLNCETEGKFNMYGARKVLLQKMAWGECDFNDNRYTRAAAHASEIWVAA